MRLFNFSLLAAGVLSMGLASCANEEVLDGTTTGAGTDGGFYAKIELNLPAGTRSTTVPGEGDYDYPDKVTGDFEIGQTDENNVNNVLLALAQQVNGQYKVVAVSSTAPAPNPNPSVPAQPVVPGYDPESPVFTITFRNEDIVTLAGQEVSLFAFCNVQNQGLDAELAVGKTIDEVTKTITVNDANPIWKSGNFMMVNAPENKIPTIELPGEADLKSKYDTAEKALDLGTVDVARVCARFDFKSSANNNTYDVNDANTGAFMAQVQIQEMALLNVAPEFYVLPRVSADGTNNNWKLCGYEYNNNFVVTPNWVKKKAETLDTDFVNSFIYSSNVDSYANESLVYTKLSDFDDLRDDNDENWGNTEGFDKTGYKIWKYVTENTLPSFGSDNVQAQKKGISTGVVFKAQIINPAERSIMANTMAARKPIYSYNGTMYGSVADLRRVVILLDDANPMRQDFKKVFPADYLEYAKDGNGDIITDSETHEYTFKVTDADLVDATSEANNSVFKIYRCDKDGKYFVYYTYRNRHNSNNNENLMRTMEFATVRNNVYKLSVTTVTDFGHAENLKDDDDPEDPDDPDEELKIYLRVACKVMPWVVRINSIIL